MLVIIDIALDSKIYVDIRIDRFLIRVSIARCATRKEKPCDCYLQKIYKTVISGNAGELLLTANMAATAGASG